MPKQDILVTGANGFVGQALLRGLDRRKYNVFALDVQEALLPGESLSARYFSQDITQPFHLQPPFDWVFHLAALNVTHVSKAGQEDYRRVNVLGTENVIKAAKTRQFVFLSTVKVYQEAIGIIDERSPIGPKNGYEQSKWEAEAVCRRYFDDNHLTVFRAANVAGPGQAEKAVIPVFFQKARQEQPLEIIYSSQTPVQLLHIADLVRAFNLLLNSRVGKGTLNLCPEEVTTLGELAEEIRALCRSSSQVRCASTGSVVIKKFTSCRAQTALGWQAEKNVQDILNDYYASITVP